MTRNSERGGERNAVIGIITYNAVDSLRRLLGEIAASQARVYPIIVADDGSTDGTAEYLRSVAVGRSAPHRGLARNRNRVLHAAFGMGYQCVVSLDDDCVILAADWIDPWLAALDTADLVAHAHHQVYPGTDIPAPAGYHAMAITRHAWEIVGDVDEAYDRGWGWEDCDHQLRADRAGLRRVGCRYGIGGGGSGRHWIPERVAINEAYHAGHQTHPIWYRSGVGPDEVYRVSTRLNYL